MTDAKGREAVAFAAWWADVHDFDFYGGGPQDANVVEFWDKLRAKKDTGHYGDCTKVPITCLRCYNDEVSTKGAAFAAALAAAGYAIVPVEPTERELNAGRAALRKHWTKDMIVVAAEVRKAMLAAAQADLTKPVWRRVEEMPEGRIWAWFRIAGMKTGEPKNWSKKDALEYGASLFSSCECPPPPPQEGN